MMWTTTPLPPHTHKYTQTDRNVSRSQVSWCYWFIKSLTFCSPGSLRSLAISVFLWQWVFQKLRCFLKAFPERQALRALTSRQPVCHFVSYLSNEKGSDKNIRRFENDLLVPEWKIKKAIIGYVSCFSPPDICLVCLNQLLYHAASAQLWPRTHHAQSAIIFCRTVVGTVHCLSLLWCAGEALALIYSHWQPFSQLSMLNQQQRLSDWLFSQVNYYMKKILMPTGVKTVS